LVGYLFSDLSPFDGSSGRSIPQQHRGSFSHCDLSNAESMSGEQEEKVFLLAEQIIAALPDRIKACTTMIVTSEC
jgi:hypothetical protein